MKVELINEDCLEEMKKLDDNSVDSIVTDPPYGLKFMNKKWDADVPGVEVWQEAIRVLKPGGHLISFGGTRTYHRMAVAIEDAGFEIRDMVSWIYGSGFPKSLNIGKAVDKLQGNERKVVGKSQRHGGGKNFSSFGESLENNPKPDITKGNSPWEGWGSALKPAVEPCVLARKPLSEKTVAKNVLRWGTGGLNIDGCRVRTNENLTRPYGGENEVYGEYKMPRGTVTGEGLTGRFPANLCHDGSDEVLEVFPNESHRFFYAPKASKAERNRGLEDMKEKAVHRYGAGIGEGKTLEAPAYDKNHHPTVKPIALMEYMVKLITPPNGTVLDPFMGSGSTGIAAKKLGHNFIGIEREAEYIEIAKKRTEALQDDK